MKKDIKKNLSSTRTRFTPVMITMCVVLCIYVVSLIVPFVWAIITSFKSRLDFLANPIGLPEKWVWNYGTVFSKFAVMITNDKVGQQWVPLWRMFVNSLLYAGGSAIVSTIVPCVTAYACARFDYKFSKVIYTIVIVTMILPIVGNMPSIIVVTRALGLYDHIWGMWIVNASFLDLYFLVFYSSFKSIPKDYAEAAKIDGANNFQIFLKVMLPLVRNLLFTVMLIKFINFWNDYQTPLMYIPSSPTVAYGLYLMEKTTENSMNIVPMRMAASVIMFTPIIIVFLLTQKRLLGNLMVGGIKG